MPGTPMAKSHSFSSPNCLIWRGVISCSARPLRSSGLSGGWFSIPSSSPFTRNVGGRPTLRWRSEPPLLIISCRTALKFSGVAATVASGAVGLAIRRDTEKDLPVFNRLRVLHEHLAHDAAEFGLDLVHDLHRFDDADDLAVRDAIADRTECLRARLGGRVERADHRRLDLEQL